jgi:hypothetical protein
MEPYRRAMHERGPKLGPVTVGAYLDLLEAELARSRLEAEDIDAIVIEPTGFNPLLTAAAGGILLQVDGSDRRRAEEILAQPAPEPEVEDAEDADESAVRCPRCELTYCSHARAIPSGGFPHPLLAVGYVVSRKRWRCQRCEHVWDDPKQGARAMTRLLPGDPRPVFRLQRAHPGMGLLLGGMCGVVVAIVLQGSLAAPILLVGLAALGWFIGRWFRKDFCSEPQCRAQLLPGAEECPRCKGAIAGSITRASAHYSAAADFRRELAMLRARDAALAGKNSKRTKKRRVRAKPATAGGLHRPDS